MDIKELKKVKIVNHGGSRIVSHAFSLPHGEEIDIETNRLPEHILNDLNIFHARGQIDFIPLEDAPKKSIIEKHTETIMTANGREHVVYKPQEDKAINVESIDTSGKSVEVGFSKMDAIDLLGKHWKTLEKEVLETKDVSKLKLLHSVAREQEVTGKKMEIIESRLGELV
jgi:hypothetical protein